ncbi:Translin [Coprinopsis sp. MPI-PUGE-AT-0042]|nr:Translin [Coprinopsis sp. MPI-PUGE-AT-0042]
MFEQHRDALDEFNDRRERLIKASRDITNLSKKTIFLLHRLALEAPPTSTISSTSHAAGQGYIKLLHADLFWRHERQISPGLQEYIEALGFAYYLDCGRLISYAEVQRWLSDEGGVPFFPLTISDYLLGLSDLTGELVRYAISGLSRKGGRQKAIDICVFVRNCKADFERFTPYIRDLRKKQAVTANSLEKIEDAVYTIFLRTSEYDLPPEILDEIVAQTLSSHNGGSGRDRTGTGGGGIDYDEDGY